MILPSGVAGRLYLPASLLTGDSITVFDQEIPKLTQEIQVCPASESQALASCKFLTLEEDQLDMSNPT